MDKLISIIVPVYNVKAYLDRCIISLINQTYKNLEIILVDDGSKDGSGAICDKYASEDSRIKVIHKQNGGVSSARNLGLDIATGEYIGFIDSDDYVETGMYEALYNVAVSENADMTMTGFTQVRVGGNSQINEVDFSIDWSKENIIKNYFKQGIVKEIMYSPCNKLYKKSLINDLRFSEKYRMGEDILFIFQCVERANKFSCVKGVFYNYVMRENSAMTSSFSKKRLDYIYAIKEIQKACIEKYSFAVSEANIWVYCHVLNTLRQIIVAKKRKKYQEFYRENKRFLRKNKKIYKKQLSINQRIDYFLIMNFPFLLKLKVCISSLRGAK